MWFRGQWVKKQQGLVPEKPISANLGLKFCSIFLYLYLHVEISVRVVPKYRRFEKELIMAGDKSKHSVWALPLSLRSLIINYLSAEL